MQIEFPYYPAHVNSKKPLGTVTLEEFINANKNPNEHIKNIFNQIAAAEVAGDIKLKATLKQGNLFYFTPCVRTDNEGRGYVNVTGFNGIAVLDFDHIDNAEDFKQFVFDTYKFVICAFLSPSKKGVKFLVKIPVIQKNTPGPLWAEAPEMLEFKSYFFGLALEFEQYNGFDGTGQNCVLPLFLSWDPDLLQRSYADTWTKRGKKINAFLPSDYAPVVIESTGDDKEHVKRIIMSAIDKIVDNGHPQLRAAAVTLGGYIATGYIDKNEGVNFINQLIQNNSYLKKGVSGYQKTAATAIDKGMLSQLFLEKQ